MIESLYNFRENVCRLLNAARTVIYPSLFANGKLTEASEKAKDDVFMLLQDILPQVLPEEDKKDPGEIAEEILRQLPGVKEMLETDLRAAYEGDPAARSIEEIMLAYPAFEAISIFRVAHVFYTLGIPTIPRMMTEYAHRQTGIDIHPGATIGEYFFIDHGTGVVIGETTTIGEHVKLYQGVTLGAKSFAVNADGTLVKGIKRHPDVGNNVVIYAGATILGGNTSIGDNCIIGGNVWLTHSVSAGSRVLGPKPHNSIFKDENR